MASDARWNVDRGRGIATDPETALLQLLECVEEYLVAKRHQEFRREVTEYRAQLGNDLVEKAMAAHIDHALTGSGKEYIVLDTTRERERGVIGRYPEPDERYVFDLARPQYYPVHMLGVRRPLRVTWLLDGEIVHRKTLRPWIGVGMAKADTVIEERPPGVEDAE